MYWNRVDASKLHRQLSLPVYVLWIHYGVGAVPVPYSNSSSTIRTNAFAIFSVYLPGKLFPDRKSVVHLTKTAIIKHCFLPPTLISVPVRTRKYLTGTDSYKEKLHRKSRSALESVTTCFKNKHFAAHMQEESHYWSVWRNLRTEPWVKEFHSRWEGHFQSAKKTRFSHRLTQEYAVNLLTSNSMSEFAMGYSLSDLGFLISFFIIVVGLTFPSDKGKQNWSEWLF